MDNLRFSKEQEDIFEYAEKGVLNMIVQAVAGAGKTTTLVECVNRISTDKKILLLAHNKSTKDTLVKKIGNRPNVKVYTLHGLAWRFFVEEFDYEPNIDEDKYRNYVLNNMYDIFGDDFLKLSKAEKSIYKSNVFDLINKSRQNLKQTPKEIKKMATKKYGLLLVGDECESVAKILSWGAYHLDSVDFQDLLWLPYEKGYFTKKNTADIIMLDEAQDASLSQQDIISRCFKRNTRLFAFGDRDQTINSWCGSDTDAFEHLKDATAFRRDAKELPLTTNYRCGRRIIEYAKKYTNNDIKACEDAIDGEIKMNVSLNDIKPNDMVLCRNISPLMFVYRHFISKGVRVYFRGEELGKQLIQMADSVAGDSIMEIVDGIKRKIVSTWNMIIKTNNLTEEEAAVDSRIVSLYDTLKTFEALPASIVNRYDLNCFISDIFSNEGKDGIELSTIHRAKGLESDNVFIVCPSLIPSPLCTQDWEFEEERHLQYVMCTRAKKTLNFVMEGEISNMLYTMTNKSMYVNLKNLKNEKQIY